MLQVINGVAYELGEAHSWLIGQSYIRMYDKHFGPQGLGPMPGRLHFTCCAQFVVPRDAIKLRSRSFYEKTLEYLAEGDIRGVLGHVDRKYVLGDGVGLYWSMIFGNARIDPAQNCTEYAADVVPARCTLVEGDLKSQGSST